MIMPASYELIEEKLCYGESTKRLYVTEFLDVGG